MNDYFDRVELELRAAAARAASAPPSAARRHRLTVGGLLSALVAGGAVVLAVAAIVVVGHGRRFGASGAKSSATVWSRPCLAIHDPGCVVAQYAILRRPQTAAERKVRLRVPASVFFAGQTLHDVHIKLVPSLTRIVPIDERTRAGINELILFVIRSSLGPPNYYLGVLLVHDGKPTYIDPGWPFIPAGGSPNPFAKWGLVRSYAKWDSGFEVSVVPDHIKSVRWAFPGRTSTGSGGGSILTLVQDNVALARISRPSGNPETSEYAADGRAIVSPSHLMSEIWPTAP